jgi:uncharacterized RDD family membrane protein YckC
VEPFPAPAPVPSGRKAGVLVRVGARLVDGLVLLVPVLVITVPIAGGIQIGTANQGVDQIAATGFAVVFSYLYFVGCETTRGATLGKQACGLEVRTAHGHPTVTQAAGRNAFMLVSVVPGSLGGVLTLIACIALAVSIAMDPGGRGFHDRWVGVTVDRRRP